MEIQLPDLQEHLAPIHDRIAELEKNFNSRLQSTEQVASDLRALTAKLEANVERLLTENPAAEQAIALATEARDLAQAALKKVEKSAVRDDPAKPPSSVQPPPPREDPPAADQPSDPPAPERRKTFLERFL